MTKFGTTITSSMKIWKPLSRYKQEKKRDVKARTRELVAAHGFRCRSKKSDKLWKWRRVLEISQRARHSFSHSFVRLDDVQKKRCNHNAFFMFSSFTLGAFVQLRENFFQGAKKKSKQTLRRRHVVLSLSPHLVVCNSHPKGACCQSRVAPIFRFPSFLCQEFR